MIKLNEQAEKADGVEEVVDATPAESEEPLRVFDEPESTERVEVVEEPIESEVPAVPEKVKKTYEEQYAELDKDFLTEWDKRNNEGYIQNIKDTFGDVLPLLPELIKDKALQKKLVRLMNKEYRELALDAAWDIHNGTPKEAAEAQETLAQIPKEFTDELESTRAEVNRLHQEKVQKEHEAMRRDEIFALAKEAPEIHYTKQDKSDPGWKVLNYLFDMAEDRTQKNFRNGNNTVVKLKEVYDEWREVSGKKPLTEKIPATSPSGPPKLQAPKNEVDAEQFKKDFLAKVRKAGGANAYAKLTSGIK